MASQAFWERVNALGLTPDTDPSYYYQGRAQPDEYRNAVRILIGNLKNQSIAIQQEIFAMIQAEGGMSPESRPSYYSEIGMGSGDMENLITTAGNAFASRYGPGATTQALPRDSRLVRIGNEYRVVWDLGGGLGHAWYSISAAHLTQLYGSVTPPAHNTLNNLGQFNAQYGDFHWGDASEISLKAETPWQDLASKINSQFGFVPGLDDPEIQRLLRQSFFENWTPDQWVVEYRKTNYYKASTDIQRSWAGKSPAQQQQEINQQLNRLSELHQDIWGTAGDRAALGDSAFKIASGQINESQWVYEQSSAAGTQSGTPEFLRRERERYEAIQWANRPEDFGLMAENLYRSWVGPGSIPSGFGTKWGADLASGAASEADLENYLKSLSQSQWQFKDPNLRWEDWAAGYKSQISEILELGSLSDSDPLLSQMLRTDLTGIDLEQMIRQDKRFQSTQKMYDELSGLAGDMGKRFGFIT